MAVMKRGEKRPWLGLDVQIPAGFRVRPDRWVVRTGCPVNDAGRGRIIFNNDGDDIWAKGADSVEKFPDGQSSS
jgi:hypothetical protein